MWRILQHECPDDFVLATGEGHSVREFVQEAFRSLGVEIGWKGSGDGEKGVVINVDRSIANEKFDLDVETLADGDAVVELDPTYYRPTEVDSLIGDASKAKGALGWEAKTRFKELVGIMIDADIELEKTSSIGST